MNADPENSTSTVGSTSSAANSSGDPDASVRSAAAEANTGDASDSKTKDEIEKLRVQLNEEQKKRKAAELHIQQYEAQIAALGQVPDDLDTIFKTYAKEQPNLVKARSNQVNYKTDETNCLENVLGKKTKDVKDIVDKAQTKIDDLSKVIDAAKEDLSKKIDDLAWKTQARDVRKQLFEALKGLSASLKGVEATLDGLARDVRTAHGNNDFAIAYWLLTYKFEPQLRDAPAVPPLDKFLTDLTYARDKYVEAIAEFYEADTKVKSATKELEAKEAQLKELEKKFDAKVRCKLSKVMPQREAA